MSLNLNNSGAIVMLRYLSLKINSLEMECVLVVLPQSVHEVSSVPPFATVELELSASY